MGIRISMHLLIGVTDLEADRVGNISDKRFLKDNNINFLDKDIVLPSYTKEKLSEDKHRFDELQKMVMRSIIKVWANVSGTDFFPAYDVVEFNSEYGIPNVIGVRVASLPYADNTLYALSALYPEFMESGFKVLPSIELEDDSSLAASLIKFRDSSRLEKENKVFEGHLNLMRDKEELIKDNHNYLWFSTDFDIWAKCALYIFKQIGFDFTKQDLKLILYWKWS